MGATQSKSNEPVIFYNQSSPFLQTQQQEPVQPKKTSTPPSADFNEKVEQRVREEVAKELERAKEQQDQRQNSTYSKLYKKNIQNDHNSVALNEDINTMIHKLQRSAPAEIPADIAKHQEQLIVCFKNNQSRPLDCWEKVEKFRDAVASEQKRFVASHQ